MASCTAKMCQTHLVKGLISSSYSNSAANKALGYRFCHPTPFRPSLSALLSKPCYYCSWLLPPPISSCSLQLTKYLTNRLITLLSVSSHFPSCHDHGSFDKPSNTRWRGMDSNLALISWYSDPATDDGPRCRRALIRGSFCVYSSPGGG